MNHKLKDALAAKLLEMSRDEKVKKISVLFSKNLVEQITANLKRADFRERQGFSDISDVMDEIRRRNETNGPTVCASHDFCDANMSMIEAFEEVLGREGDAGSDDDAALMNDAWDDAKRNGFRHV